MKPEGLTTMWRVTIATLLTALGVTATAQDALRIQELRQEINELQRLVRDQSRRIDALERQISQAKIAPSPGVSSRSASAAPKPSSDKWLVPAAWERLRTGMTEQQVLDVLGYPTTARGTGASKTLFYTVQVGASGFLSGRVVIVDNVVQEIQKPVLR
jgi:hypothetical protein